MLTPDKIVEKVNKTVMKYGVRCIRAVFNIQGTVDIELDENIYTFEDKQSDEIEEQIRKAIPNVNDIYSLN